MEHKPERPQRPEDKLRSAQQQIRAGVNEAGVAMVQAGFEAIDQLADSAGTALKKAILRGLGAKTK